MLGRKSPPTKEPFIPRDSRPDLYLNGADQATDGRGAGSILAKQPDREPQRQHKPNDKTPDKEPDTEPPKPNDGEVAGPQPGRRDGEPGMVGLIEELMRPGSGSSRS